MLDDPIRKNLITFYKNVSDQFDDCKVKQHGFWCQFQGTNRLKSYKLSDYQGDFAGE